MNTPPRTQSDPKLSTQQNFPWQAVPARALGYAGAVVIPALLLLGWIYPEMVPWASRISVVYGATILSFLGGIQWGFAVNHNLPAIGLRRLITSVIPSLWAAIALTLPIKLCAIALVVGFVVLLSYEWLERNDGIYPVWYLPLRLQLTTMITASLALVALT